MTAAVVTGRKQCPRARQGPGRRCLSLATAVSGSSADGTGAGPGAGPTEAVLAALPTPRAVSAQKFHFLPLPTSAGPRGQQGTPATRPVVGGRGSGFRGRNCPPVGGRAGRSPSAPPLGKGPVPGSPGPRGDTRVLSVRGGPCVGKPAPRRVNECAEQRGMSCGSTVCVCMCASVKGCGRENASPPRGSRAGGGCVAGGGRGL